MALIYIGLGSNLGNRQHYLAAARKLLSLWSLSPIQCSPIYESAPVGGEEGAAPYLNQVVTMESSLAPQDLLFVLKGAERMLGRTPRGHWMSREIDMDLLLYDQQIVQAGRFQVPHASLAIRQFMLKPLCDLSPDLIHPLLDQKVQSLLQNAIQTQGLDDLKEWNDDH